MPTKPEEILRIRDLAVHFEQSGSTLARLLGRPAGIVKAVDGINLTLRRGEVLGLVGESGSGKTTLGRTILGLAPATAGTITYTPSDGQPVDIATLKGARLRAMRQKLQMVFQDPHAALNPSMTLETAVGHPLVIHKRASGAELRDRVAAALERVGLSPAEQFLAKYPSDLSGGQKQRAVMARAVIVGPELVVADEPVSMLDMSVRAKVLQLMLDLKRDLGLTYVYVTHDLATAKFFCDRVAIMYLGKIVEIGPSEEIFADPKHPYTRSLLKAIPDPDPSKAIPRDLPRGEIPDAARPPRGCSFHPRCPLARGECGWEPRDLKALVEEHWTRDDLATFRRESELVGGLVELATDASEVVVQPARGKGTADDVWTMFNRIRDLHPDEPLWRGVTAMEKVDGGVRFAFQAASPIVLRPVHESEVACVLYE